MEGQEDLQFMVDISVSDRPGRGSCWTNVCCWARNEEGTHFVLAMEEDRVCGFPCREEDLRAVAQSVAEPWKDQAMECVSKNGS